MIILRQTNYSEKEESKAQKIAKSSAILGSGVAALGGAASLGGKVISKGNEKAMKEALTKGKGAEAMKQAVKGAKISKLAKKSGKVGALGLGASVASGLAYKALDKKKDKK